LLPHETTTASTNTKNSIVTAFPKTSNIAIEPTSANSLQDLDLQRIGISIGKDCPLCCCLKSSPMFD
jgi:hypothetical protein